MKNIEKEGFDKEGLQLEAIRQTRRDYVKLQSKKQYADVITGKNLNYIKGIATLDFNIKIHFNQDEDEEIDAKAAKMDAAVEKIQLELIKSLKKITDDLGWAEER